MNQHLWKITQKEFKPLVEKKYETLFTLANGYRGLRGAIDFSRSAQRMNLIAGIFDKADSAVNEIVNCQDPLGFSVYLEDEPLELEKCKILDFGRTLDMLEGKLSMSAEVETNRGKKLRIRAERFVSRENVHRWGAEYFFYPLNFSGRISVENTIDGTVLNSSQSPFYTVKHLNITNSYELHAGIAMESATADGRYEIIEHTLLKAECGGENFFNDRRCMVFGERIKEVYTAYVESGKEYRISKYGVTFTSRDNTSDLRGSCIDEMYRFLQLGLHSEVRASKESWRKFWKDSDIVIDGDDKAQIAIRFNIFHLASSAYDRDEKVSIAAKALHGEGYKGHVFWDTEIFMLPFYLYTQPDTARALIMYRYNNLAGARANAKSNGFKGAQFPWESADDGLETTPKWGFDYDGNPVRIWTGDEEYHINSDIVYCIWEYYKATGDKEFMKKYGVEILLDTSVFWQSRLEYNHSMDRYEINKVIGPDEFHEHVDNNAYTNYLAYWSMKKSLEMAEWLKQEDFITYERLCAKLGLSSKDFTMWDRMLRKIFIPKSKDGKLIEQFEGYFNLKDIEIEEFDDNGLPIWPDLKGHKLCETQLLKQADVVMLMILLGEEFDAKTKLENFSYYEKRTMHKSSLSPSMYSIMGIKVGDFHKSYNYFIKTAMTDLEDHQGNTDIGIHAASAGGSWQSAVFGFGGFSLDNDSTPSFNPWMPEHWNRFEFKVKISGNTLHVVVSKTDVCITSEKKSIVKVYGKIYEAEKDGTIHIPRDIHESHKISACS